MEAGAGDDTGNAVTAVCQTGETDNRKWGVEGSRDAELHNPTPRLFYNREISEIMQVAFISKTIEAGNY